MKITYFCDAWNLFSLAAILNFAFSKSVFRGLDNLVPRALFPREKRPGDEVEVWSQEIFG